MASETPYEDDAAPAARRGRGGGMLKLIVAAVVIVVLVAAYLLLTGSGGTVITTSGTETLTHAPQYFTVGQRSYSIALSSEDKASGVAYVYVTQQPAFLNELLNVTLNLNSTTKVNSASSYADLGLELVSLGNGSATVKISALDPSLQLQPDLQYIRLVPALLTGTGGASGAANTSQGSAPSTTVATTTTTVSATNTTKLAIQEALKGNRYYELMLNMTRLYRNTPNCTELQYNNTYVMYYDVPPPPPGPVSYMNESPSVPYNVYNTTTNVGGGDYLVAFATETSGPQFDDVSALTLEVNISTKSVISSNVTADGIFAGSNYTNLDTLYQGAVALNGACAIEVA